MVLGASMLMTHATTSWRVGGEEGCKRGYFLAARIWDLGFWILNFESWMLNVFGMHS